MSKHRRAAKVDSNQNDIVKKLRQIPGVTVEVGYNDILVGFKGRTYWFEVKNPKRIIKKTGNAWNIQDDQKRILETFTGHYKVVYSLEEILTEIGLLR